MIALASGVRVYLACGITDMRRGMTGLAMMVQQGLAADPFDEVAPVWWTICGLGRCNLHSRLLLVSDG